MRTIAILVRHLFLVWRAGQMRFRFETFGLYYPALPYTSPIWRPPIRNLALLARQTAAYARWVSEMESIRRSGAGAWWGDRHLNSSSLQMMGDTLDDE